ncbi:MAG: hypothetical protein WCR45_09760, partial [Bacteroidaceae bacterium]
IHSKAHPAKIGNNFLIYRRYGGSTTAEKVNNSWNYSIFAVLNRPALLKEDPRLDFVPDRLDGSWDQIRLFMK